MKAHELLTQNWQASNKGFRLVNGKVVWKKAYMDGDRRRVKITRKAKDSYGLMVERVRYVQPHTEMELIPRA